MDGLFHLYMDFSSDGWDDTILTFEALLCIIEAMDTAVH